MKYCICGGEEQLLDEENGFSQETPSADQPLSLFESLGRGSSAKKRDTVTHICTYKHKEPL